jgi:hypothetical protein
MTAGQATKRHIASHASLSFFKMWLLHFHINSAIRHFHTVKSIIVHHAPINDYQYVSIHQEISVSNPKK